MIIILFLIIHLLISLNESENALANDVTDITCVTYHVNVKMCQQMNLNQGICVKCTSKSIIPEGPTLGVCFVQVFYWARVDCKQQLDISP